MCETTARSTATRHRSISLVEALEVSKVTEVSLSNCDHSEDKNRSISAIFSSEALESLKLLTKFKICFSRFSKKSLEQTLSWCEEHTRRSASILESRRRWWAKMDKSPCLHLTRYAR